MEAASVDHPTVPLGARELGKRDVVSGVRERKPPKASRGSAPQVASRVPVRKGPRVWKVGDREMGGDMGI